MSNAEEIVAKYKQVSTHRLAGRNAMLVDMIEEYAQAHTNQTLQDLKEKVEDKLEYQRDIVFKDCKWIRYDHQQATCKIDCYEELITLIDEAINE